MSSGQQWKFLMYLLKLERIRLWIIKGCIFLVTPHFPAIPNFPFVVSTKKIMAKSSRTVDSLRFGIKDLNMNTHQGQSSSAPSIFVERRASLPHPSLPFRALRHLHRRRGCRERSIDLPLYMFLPHLVTGTSSSSSSLLRLLLAPLDSAIAKALPLCCFSSFSFQWCCSSNISSSSALSYGFSCILQSFFWLLFFSRNAAFPDPTVCLIRLLYLLLLLQHIFLFSQESVFSSRLPKDRVFIHS